MTKGIADRSDDLEHLALTLPLSSYPQDDEIGRRVRNI
jgi:hypothetical protein